MRLLERLERRAAVLELVSDALEPRRPVVHVGPELGGDQLHDVSLIGATYGIRSTPLGAVGLVGPLRMDYEKAIRSVRAAAFELSRFVEDVYDEP
jgi:heat-inducible transcriptional repressor